MGNKCKSCVYQSELTSPSADRYCDDCKDGSLYMMTISTKLDITRKALRHLRNIIVTSNIDDDNAIKFLSIIEPLLDLIKHKDLKKCPVCGSARINLIDYSCDDMYCFECESSFGGVTGEVKLTGKKIIDK